MSERSNKSIGRPCGEKIVGSSDLGDTTVCCHDDNGCLVTFESSIKVREAFDIEHVHLIDEEHTWNDFSSAFFSPFGHFLIDLFSNFWFDLTNVTSE